MTALWQRELIPLNEHEVRVTENPAKDGVSEAAEASTEELPAFERAHVFEVAHAVRTHTGLVRDHNEDNYAVLESHGIYLVADGMGGHAAGKEASQLCVDSVRDFFKERRRGREPKNTDTIATPDTARIQGVQPNGQVASSDAVPDSDGQIPVPSLSTDALEYATSLQEANRLIYEASSTNKAYAGMGTTAVGVRLFDDMVAISHAGDSRCYLLRNGHFRQITVDHSLSNFLLALGREVEAQLAEATMSNVIMRALGLEPEVVIDTQEFRLRPGDRLLLCSDGLSDLVSPAHLRQMAENRENTLDEIADECVQAALDGGGRDNITVLILDVLKRAPGFQLRDAPTAEHIAVGADATLPPTDLIPRDDLPERIRDADLGAEDEEEEGGEKTRELHLVQPRDGDVQSHGDEPTEDIEPVSDKGDDD